MVAFYGQYDDAPEDERTEEAPASAEAIEEVLDESPGGDFADGESPEAFDNIKTGVLEHDLARNEPALPEETEDGEVLDLGRVEGLSGAPSTLRGMTQPDESTDEAASDTMKNAE